MLKKLRSKKTAKKIWIALAILIVPAFIMWGFSGALRGKQESDYAGKIFGKKISLSEYQGALDASKNQAIIQFGDKISEIQKYLNFKSMAWERLTLFYEAKKRKIKITDQEVIELIESYPFFKGAKGKFDNQTYSEMLQYVFHAQPRVFEEQTRQNLMLSKLYKEVTDHISLTEKEIKEEYYKLNEEISIYYIASLPGDFLKEVTSSEQEIKDYFVKNSFQFKQPISFNIEYIALESEDKIRDIISRLNKKEDFIKVAGSFNLAVKESGFFAQTDPIPGIGWSPQILALLPKANIGQVLPPMHADKYYYMLRLKGRKETYVPDFLEIKDKVKETFIKDKSQKIAREKIENCLKKLKEAYQSNPKSADFNKLAKEFGLKSDSAGLFKYGSYIEGIGASDDFWMAVKGLKEGELSGVIEMPSGFYIVKLKSRIPVDNKKFETEKTAFSQHLLSQKKQEYFTKFVEELKRETGVF